MKRRYFFGIAFLLTMVCALSRCGFFGGDTITFSEHIAPIIHKSCAGCHRPEGVAPFSLLTYKEVKRKAKTIAKVTRLGIMPPWPADPEYSHFAGENYLTEEEKNLIQQWAKNGAPEGDPKKLKPYSAVAYKSSLGKPDMVLYLDSVHLDADMRDRFFLIKIPGKISRDTYVRAVEFVAGNPNLVHHFNGHLLLYEDGKKMNVFSGMKRTEITGGEYENDFERLDLLHDDGSKPERVHSVVNYLPGVLGTAYPAGIGTFKLSKNFAFVGNDLHYGPSDKKVTDVSRINLFFTATPPDRELGELMLGTNGVSKIEPALQIPANKVTTHTTRYTINQDISVLTINPHLHMLGKTFQAYAIKPNGDTIPLIRIKQWDFRWQYFYTFKKMVHIPRGSVVVATAQFDNTAQNPNNPNRPPKLVGERMEFGGASMRASDEMFQFIITYTAYRPGDENVSLEQP